MKNKEFYSKTHFLLFFNKRKTRNTTRREKNLENLFEKIMI